MTRPKIAAVVTSTRPTRHGPVLGRWVHSELTGRGDLDLTVVDLAAVALPLLDEPHPPADRNYTKDHTKNWSDIVDGADGFIFITPEYNRSMPASLKNALDFLFWEWQYKPVGFVSYSGGVSGGTRAVEMTKQVVTTLGMLPVPEMVNLPRIDSLIDRTIFDPPGGAAAMLHALADKLSLYVEASHVLRS